MRFTGLRSCQVMGLLWDDFDLGRALLTVRPELGKTKHEKRGRIVVLSPHFVEEVAGWGRREGWLIDRSYMPGPSAPCRFPDRRDISNKKMPKDIWKRTSIPAKVYRQPLHCFRKGFIGELAYLRAPEHIRKHLVGHSNGVHGDVYTVFKFLEAEMRESVAMIPPLHPPNVVTLEPGDTEGHLRDRDEITAAGGTNP